MTNGGGTKGKFPMYLFLTMLKLWCKKNYDGSVGYVHLFQLSKIYDFEVAEIIALRCWTDYKSFHALFLIQEEIQCFYPMGMEQNLTMYLSTKQL